MAKILGKNCEFGLGVADIGATAGPYTLAQAPLVQSLSNEVALNIETATIDTSAYGDDFDQFEVFTYNWNVDITAYLADINIGPPDTEEIFIEGLLDLTKRAFAFWPAGGSASESSVTQPKYSGRVIIQSVSIPPNRSGVVPLRVRLQGDGQLFRNTDAM
jgi:hypothetical protein